MSYLCYTPIPEAAWLYTGLHTVPVGLFALAGQHPMEAYFPKDMLEELLNSNEREAEPAAALPAPTDGSAPNGEATQDANPPEDAPPSSETRFDVCHAIQYTPWSPTQSDTRAEYQLVGTCKTLREANWLAMKEVYEKYGELAHVGRALWFPPRPNWLRKTGDRSWPNTWKIEDGQLSFSVVNSKLQYTLRGRSTS
ncbi:hypothetical protein F5B18DRAFT_598098 [Nemania serpens]|nr:hypothetical protein F5B18DRAFT_598098 [Nemania serpens]